MAQPADAANPPATDLRIKTFSEELGKIHTIAEGGGFEGTLYNGRLWDKYVGVHGKIETLTGLRWLFAGLFISNESAAKALTKNLINYWKDKFPTHVVITGRSPAQQPYNMGPDAMGDKYSMGDISKEEDQNRRIADKFRIIANAVDSAFRDNDTLATKVQGVVSMMHGQFPQTEPVDQQHLLHAAQPAAAGLVSISTEDRVAAMRARPPDVLPTTQQAPYVPSPAEQRDVRRGAGGSDALALSMQAERQEAEQRARQRQQQAAAAQAKAQEIEWSWRTAEKEVYSKIRTDLGLDADDDLAEPATVEKVYAKIKQDAQAQSKDVVFGVITPLLKRMDDIRRQLYEEARMSVSEENGKLHIFFGNLIRKARNL